MAACSMHRAAATPAWVGFDVYGHQLPLHLGETPRTRRPRG